MSNKFASALKGKNTQDNHLNIVTSIIPEKNALPTKAPREGLKHIGGYFDPVVSKQMRTLALEEEGSVQALLAEALDMLFHSRGKPTIAQKSARS
jgi:hypothetical protein